MDLSRADRNGDAGEQETKSISSIPEGQVRDRGETILQNKNAAEVFMSEAQKIAVLTESELEGLMERAVALALKKQNGKGNMLTAKEAAALLN